MLNVKQVIEQRHYRTERSPWSDTSHALKIDTQCDWIHQEVPSEFVDYYDARITLGSRYAISRNLAERANYDLVEQIQQQHISNMQDALYGDIKRRLWSVYGKIAEGDTHGALDAIRQLTGYIEAGGDDDNIRI